MDKSKIPDIIFFNKIDKFSQSFDVLNRNCILEKISLFQFDLKYNHIKNQPNSKTSVFIQDEEGGRRI